MFYLLFFTHGAIVILYTCYQLVAFAIVSQNTIHAYISIVSHISRLLLSFRPTDLMDPTSTSFWIELPRISCDQRKLCCQIAYKIFYRRKYAVTATTFSHQCKRQAHNPPSVSPKSILEANLYTPTSPPPPTPNV